VNGLLLDERSNWTCSGQILQDTGLNGKVLDKVRVLMPLGAAATCCGQCTQATNCDAWALKKDVCYLLELWKDDQHLRSNIKGNACIGRVNTGFNTGKVYKSELVTGTTDAKDARCCASCNADVTCEGWQVVTEGKDAGQCQLLRFSYAHAGWQSGFSPNSPTPHFDGTCNVAAETKGEGQFVEKHKLLSKTQLDQDGECCAHCAKTPACEFWVRDTTGNPNWCRLMKGWKRSAEWKTKRRTGFKVANRADAMYCKALDFMWRVAGAILRHITFRSVAGVENMKVNLGPGLQCDKLSFANNQVVGNLYNVEVSAFMHLDGSMKGINGDASVYLRADPNVVIDFNTCEVPHFRINDWNDGFGIDGNTGKHQHGFISTTGVLAGSYHSNLRRAGCDPSRALVGIPNHEPFSSAKKITNIQLSGATHHANDYACCQQCQSVVDCDAWHTSKGYINNGQECTLHSLWESDDGYHGNWKDLSVSRGNYKGRGATHSVIDVSGDTEEERDASCAALCVADEKCELWTQKTSDRKCMLQGALRNSGWLGVGRPVVNLIVDGLVHKLLNKLVKHICGLGGVKLVMKILEAAEHWTTTGNGSVSLDVPVGFWDSAASDFMSNASSYDSLVFVSNATGMESVRANQSALQNVVNTIIHGLADDFSAGKVVEELGTPIAFYVGSIIKECVETGCKNDVVTKVV